MGSILILAYVDCAERMSTGTSVVGVKVNEAILDDVCPCDLYVYGVRVDAAIGRSASTEWQCSSLPQ